MKKVSIEVILRKTAVHALRGAEALITAGDPRIQVAVAALQTFAHIKWLLTCRGLKAVHVGNVVEGELRKKRVGGTHRSHSCRCLHVEPQNVSGRLHYAMYATWLVQKPESSSSHLLDSFI